MEHVACHQPDDRLVTVKLAERRSQYPDAEDNPERDHENSPHEENERRSPSR